MTDVNIDKLISENVRLQQEIAKLNESLLKKEQQIKHLQNIIDVSVSDYESRLSFYDHKYPLLHYEYEQYLEDKHQSSDYDF